MFPEFRVHQDDVLKVSSDLLLLKYAERLYGAAKEAASVLTSAAACSQDDLHARPDDFLIVDTKGVIAPSRVMFLGTAPLHLFSYDQMRHFAARSIEILAGEDPPVRRMTTVIHGVGYGLDAVESLQSLVQGFREGVAKQPAMALNEIVFVERNERRARILSSALAELRPEPPLRRSELREDTLESGPPEVPLRSPRAGARAEQPPRVSDRPAPAKRHVFVAMPYAEEFEDVYEFGIYEPVRRCGFICERVDQAAFTGDILKRIRERIETADLVIADLTGARPNVYLEVGYAWGKEVPVVFVARHGDEPHFDVRAHRCIYYRTIKQLARELEQLIPRLPGLEN